MTNGTTQTTQTPTPQASPQAAPQTPAPKKGKGLKIFLGILGGCLVVLIIAGIVGWIMVKKAAKKAGQELEKASKEWEKTLNEMEKANLQLNELNTAIPTTEPAETTKPTPGP